MSKLATNIAAIATILMAFMGTTHAGHYGPARSLLALGELGTGIVYSYDTAEWDGTDVSFGNAEAAFEEKSIETRQNNLSLQISLGLGKGWEATGSVGIADMTIENGHLFSETEFEGEFRPVYSLTVGGPVYSGETVTVAPFVQGKYIQLYNEEALGEGTDGVTEYAGVENVSIKNLYNFAIGLKFQMDVEGTLLYYGPVYSRGKSSYRASFIAANNPTVTGMADGDIETEHDWSGFVGICYPLPLKDWPFAGWKTVFDVEGRYDSQFSGSTALNFVF